MRRREFIGLLGLTAASWPPAVRAQSAEPAKYVAVVMGWSADREHRDLLDAFIEALTGLSSAQYRALRIEQRWTNADAHLARALAREVVAAKPDVIFATTTPVVAALREETGLIPIVFTSVSDPLGSNFVESLSHPGGNITGFLHAEPKLSGKCLALLKEAAPGIERAAILFNPEIASDHGRFHLETFKAIAKSLGIEPLAAPVRSEDDIETAIAALGSQRVGFVVMDEAFMAVKYRAVIAAAARMKAPAIAPLPRFAADGGLMAYCANFPAFFREAAGYVDRILLGEKPADLPVQATTEFRMSVNLETARTLGLELPPTLLAAAAEVIQ